MNETQNAQQWSLWPLLYLDARWSGPVYDCFSLGVKVVRADRDALEGMKGAVGSNARFPGQYVFDGDVQWLLALPIGEEFQYADSVSIGVSTREEVAEALAKTFLLSLRLVRQTCCVCPVWFKGEISTDGHHVRLDENQNLDYEDPWLDWDRARVIGEEPFEESDLVEVVEVWDRLVDCLSLKDFLAGARHELFWQEIDKQATHQTRDKMSTKLASLGLPLESQRIVLSVFDATLQDQHAEAFRTGFRARMDEAFLRATRIGRALGLFNASFSSDAMGAFLWTCFALETLFTFKEEDGTNPRKITKKLMTRTARLAFPKARGQEMEALKCKVGCVLEERGEVVHGSKSIESVPEGVQRDAIDFARRCLRAILSRPRLLAMYCDPSTGATKARREDVGRLREFFKGLEAGTDCLPDEES